MLYVDDTIGNFSIDDVDESQLGMLVVHSLCENVNYKYMNGVNCLYLNFEKKIR